MKGLLKFFRIIAKFSNICSKIKIIMFAVLLAACLFCLVMAEIQACALSEEMECALQWAIQTANDDSHGYSQVNRWGNPDYDCSSFVICALRSAGIPTLDADTTRNLKANLTAGNFTWIPRGSRALSDTDWLERGDILLSNGHTEIYLGNRKTVAAHQNYGYSKSGDQNGKEISVGNYWYDNKYGNWQGVLRYYHNSDSEITDTCTEEYAGYYEVVSDVNFRTGHGTGSSILGVIPAGTVVTVTKADGSWAHVDYQGQEGFCSMKLLQKTDKIPELIPGDVNLDFVLDTKDLLIVQDWLLGIGSLPLWQNADLDQDGKITIFDLTAMKQLLLSES
ncbi:MAG: SH3 domain-containing protein [Oscillospiraceae bacterium]|nr:SH3 domain-containing protein [Oscillospiraceae bacterium]MDE5884767.1 SH3 domain-containing protein [Oscillospiraceae bacterium]